MMRIYNYCSENCCKWNCKCECECNIKKCFECSCKCISIIFIILWTVFSLLVAVLVSVSIGLIDINQIGLKFDTVNFVLNNNTIYLPGRYWIGLGKQLVIYQSSWTNVIFTKDNNSMIPATSLDSANLYIELTLMYRIRSEFTYLIYINFPDGNYYSFYRDLVANEIQIAAQNYAINNFLNLRQNISQVLTTQVNLAFRDNYAEIMSFQLGQIYFDDVYENFLLQKAITNNEKDVNILNGNLSILNANIDLLKSNTQLAVNQIISMSNQNASIFINNAIANGEMNITLSQANTLNIFVRPNGLNFTSQELNKFLLYDKLNDLSSFNSTINNFSFGIGGGIFYYK